MIHKRFTSSRTKILLSMAMAIAMAVAMLLGSAGVALAQNPAPVQVFYVTLPEIDALDVLSAINSAAVNPMYTYFSIAIAVDSTYVYYDQWEDGYAADIANPTSAEKYSSTNLDGVQIWGNGAAADGCPPNINSLDLICTNGNDVLHAGDVIIPYNSVDLGPHYNVLDAFSAVAYSNNHGNTNWSGNWVETGDNFTGNYRDEFASRLYDLSVGSIPWTTSWIEQNDDGLPTGGDITINLGASYGLEIGDTTAVGVAIYRVVNLSGYTAATLSYDFQDSATQNDDAVQVQVRNPPAAFVTLATINGTSNAGTRTHDITAYMDSDTEVRFYVSAALENNDEIYFDNVDIAVSGPGVPGAGDILITGSQLRFFQTQVNDSISRGVSLPHGR